MFARGIVYLHAAHLPVPKIPAAKPCVSITSKLIETKRLQVLHSGHLRKTGGRGSYPLCQQEFGSPSFPRSFPPISTLASLFFNHLRTLSFLGSQLSRALPASCALLCKKPGVHLYPEQTRRAHPSKLQRRRAISFISPRYEHEPRKSPVSPTYAKTGGYAPTQKCRRADILDFSPYFSHFLALSAARRVVPAVALAEEGPPSFPLVFLSPCKLARKLPRVSQYTALIGPLSP